MCRGAKLCHEPPKVLLHAPQRGKELPGFISGVAADLLRQVEAGNPHGRVAREGDGVRNAPGEPSGEEDAQDQGRHGEHAPSIQRASRLLTVHAGRRRVDDGALRRRKPVDGVQQGTRGGLEPVGVFLLDPGREVGVHGGTQCFGRLCETPIGRFHLCQPSCVCGSRACCRN